jgi:hypothetical protein
VEADRHGWLVHRWWMSYRCVDTRINTATDFTAQRSDSDRTKIKPPLDRLQNHCPTPHSHRPVVRAICRQQAVDLSGSGRYRRNVPAASGPFIDAAVLVHGLWGNPHDWRWVKGLLEDADVQVITPDLPSHRTPMAGLSRMLPKSATPYEPARRQLLRCAGRTAAVSLAWRQPGTRRCLG